VHAGEQLLGLIAAAGNKGWGAQAFTKRITWRRIGAPVCSNGRSEEVSAYKPRICLAAREGLVAPPAPGLFSSQLSVIGLSGETAIRFAEQGGRAG